MISIVTILKTISIPICLGYMISRLITRKDPMPALVNLAVGYGIGMGLLTHWFLLISTFHIPLNFSSTFVPLIALMIILFLYCIFRSRKENFTKLPIFEFKLDIPSIIVILFMLSIIQFVFWRALNIPLSSWDAYSCNGFKAKAIYFEQSLDFLHNMPHFEYPLHVPFLQVWAALNAEMWHEHYIKVFFPVYFLCLLVIVYYFLRQHAPQLWSLGGTALLCCSSMAIIHSTISYRDMTLTYYLNSAIIFMVMALSQNNNEKLVLAGLMAGLATFVKLEAIGYLGVLLLILFGSLCCIKRYSVTDKIRTFFMFFAPSIIIVCFYNIYKLVKVIPKIPHQSGEKLSFDIFSIQMNIGADSIHKISTVLHKMVENLFISGNWSLLWLLFVVSLLDLKKKLYYFEVKILLITLASFFLIQILGYSFTQYHFWIAHTYSSLSRHLLHHFPIVIMLIILLNTREEHN